MNKPANYWNFNTINAVAQQCKSIAEFRERFMSAYTTAGYGAFWKNEKKRAVPAHRMSLELADINIPKGLVVDHICKNRGCVNPKHLRLVTPRVNALENTNSICVKFRKKE